MPYTELVFCQLTGAGFTMAMQRSRDVVRYGCLLRDLGMSADVLAPLVVINDGAMDTLPMH